MKATTTKNKARRRQLHLLDRKSFDAHLATLSRKRLEDFAWCAFAELFPFDEDGKLVTDNDWGSETTSAICQQIDRHLLITIP